MGAMKSAIVILMLLVATGIADTAPDEQNQKGILFFLSSILLNRKKKISKLVLLKSTSS